MKNNTSPNKQFGVRLAEVWFWSFVSRASFASIDRTTSRQAAERYKCVLKIELKQNINMKNCPNCKEEVDKNFELCWNCNYSFSEKKIVDIKDLELQGDKDLNCLRCGVSMLFSGNYKFHEGVRLGVIGAIGEIFVNRESFNLYLCPKCGKVEFFSPAYTN